MQYTTDGLTVTVVCEDESELADVQHALDELDEADSELDEDEE